MKNKEKLISVISPIYKVEGYLKKCVDSILNQTYQNIEIILVDDGSPDSCGKICDEYSKKDNRVVVIHKENGGAPSARNAGIKIAKGEYFYFPDSDDWLEPNYLENLYNCAQKYNSELVISGFTQEYYESSKSFSYSLVPDEQNYKNQKSVRNNIHKYFDNMMVAVPWNKLYKAEYIKKYNIEFPNLKWDDLHFNMEVLKNISSVSICACDGYHFFRSRPGSETTKVFDQLLYFKRKEQFEHILNVYSSWNLDSDDIYKTLYGYYSSRIVQCVQEISISNCRYKEKRELIKDIINDDFNKKAFRKGSINSKLLRISIVPLKMKNITLSIIMGKIIGFVKKNMASIFYSLKSKSINKAKKVSNK